MYTKPGSCFPSVNHFTTLYSIYSPHHAREALKSKQHLQPVITSKLLRPGVHVSQSMLSFQKGLSADARVVHLKWLCNIIILTQKGSEDDKQTSPMQGRRKHTQCLRETCD
jgi:hypothetical protein